MRKLILLGAIFLGVAAPASAQTHFDAGKALAGDGHAASSSHPYWWPGMVNCTFSTGTRRNGSFPATPFIQCAVDPSHYSSTPAPPMAGLSACEVSNWGNPSGIAACTPPDMLGP